MNLSQAMREAVATKDAEIDRLRAEVARKDAQIARLREYAEQYAWLRDGGINSLQYEDYGLGPTFAGGDDLDEQIKQARAALAPVEAK